MRVMEGLGVIISSALFGLLIYIQYFTDYLSNFGTELSKIVQSLVFILSAYLINILIASLIKRRIQDVKQRYSLRKTISTLISIATVGILIAVWFRETTSLIVAYGILSAGIAIALQDVLKSMAGGLIIFVSGPFKAGDRIQVGNEIGDVLDIKIFYTTLMEIREWIDGDQYSGRIIQLPNSFILNSSVKNYTRDFSFIWDEIHLMFTFDCNWKKAQEITLEIAHEITGQFKTSAKKELVSLGDKYFITQADVEDTIYTQITDNWVDMRLRYVVDPRKRRSIKHAINEKLLEAFQQESDIEIASASFDIVGFPDLTINK
jgi:small-conductance mechanosensitive channel